MKNSYWVFLKIFYGLFLLTTTQALALQDDCVDITYDNKKYPLCKDTLGFDLATYRTGLIVSLLPLLPDEKVLFKYQNGGNEEVLDRKRVIPSILKSGEFEVGSKVQFDNLRFHAGRMGEIKNIFPNNWVQLETNEEVTTDTCCSGTYKVWTPGRLVNRDSRDLVLIPKGLKAPEQIAFKTLGSCEAGDLRFSVLRFNIYIGARTLQSSLYPYFDLYVLDDHDAIVRLYERESAEQPPETTRVRNRFERYFWNQAVSDEIVIEHLGQLIFPFKNKEPTLIFSQIYSRSDLTEYGDVIGSRVEVDTDFTGKTVREICK